MSDSLERLAQRMQLGVGPIETATPAITTAWIGSGLVLAGTLSWEKNLDEPSDETVHGVNTLQSLITGDLCSMHAYCNTVVGRRVSIGIRDLPGQSLDALTDLRYANYHNAIGLGILTAQATFISPVTAELDGTASAEFAQITLMAMALRGSADALTLRRLNDIRNSKAFSTAELLEGVTMYSRQAAAAIRQRSDDRSTQRPVRRIPMLSRKTA